MKRSGQSTVTAGGAWTPEELDAMTRPFPNFYRADSGAGPKDGASGASQRMPTSKRSPSRCVGSQGLDWLD